MNAVGSEVKLVRWPAEKMIREQYQKSGELRILVIEAGVAAPVCSDIREDWVRAPVSREDLRARIASLEAKVDLYSVPQVDKNGVLRFDGRAISISPTETGLLEILVLNFRCLVPREVLREHLVRKSGVDSRNALDLHIMRIRRRIMNIGLVIQTAWGRGYILERAEVAT